MIKHFRLQFVSFFYIPFSAQKINWLLPTPAKLLTFAKNT